MKEFKTQLEFAQDTINYYWGKPERVCINEDGQCRYSPISENTEGCAIGRYLSPELQKELDTSTIYAVNNTELFNKLPKWMQDLDQGFLRNCQALHDGEYLVNKDKNAVNEKLLEFINTSLLVFPEE